MLSIVEHLIVAIFLSGEWVNLAIVKALVFMNIFTVQTAIILFLLKNLLIVSCFGYLLNGLHVNLNVHVSECNAWTGFKLNCINMSLCALLLCCFIHVNDAMSPHRFY